MSFYQKIIEEKDLDTQSINNTWELFLSEQEFEELNRELKYARQWNLAPKDAALYYAEWWKRCYNGGIPSKEMLFKSIHREDTQDLDAYEFYKKAKLGGQQLGYKWIERQNRLYFRTLLLQGGLPLRHISNNQGNYKDFLLAVLEIQPETVEEINSRPDLTELLPKSSRNNAIYQSCLDIVNAILDNDDKYDHLFSENRSLADIVNDLRIRKNEVGRKKRVLKPQVYWVLSEKHDKLSIRLQLGFADTYKSNALVKAFGIDFKSKTYQFYIDDSLICVFRERVDGKYQTHWKGSTAIYWDGNQTLPSCYILGNNERQNTSGFIPVVPNLNKPTLWENLSENKWRLVRGNSIRSESGLLIYPKNWKSELHSKNIEIYNKEMFWTTFEGEVCLIKDGKTNIYKSSVAGFDWSIIGYTPSWLRKSDMPLIRQKPEIWVYNDDNEMVQSNDYEVLIRPHLKDDWQRLEGWSTLPLGCLDVKIIHNEIVAHDLVYNIGKSNIKYKRREINCAEFEICENHRFNLIISETDLVDVTQDENSFELSLNPELLKVPLGIPARLKKGKQKSVLLELENPFQGVALVSKQGNIIKESKLISLKNLNGIRILSPAVNSSSISFRNKIRYDDVIISKELKAGSVPLMSYIDEIEKLFHLADVMRPENGVSIQISSNGKSKSFSIKSYTHSIDISMQLENEIYLSDEAEIDLLAIPLNCRVSQIELIPIFKEDQIYRIPILEDIKQFIIISSVHNDNKVLPRFVNVDPDFDPINPADRIEKYHKDLLNANFDDDIWKEILSYFKICKQQEVPFSTLDQIRAISRSSKVAAKAFFYLGINQQERTEFIQQDIPALERDLDFCFHWVCWSDWGDSLSQAIELIGMQYYKELSILLSEYIQNNNLGELLPFIFGGSLEEVDPVLNPNLLSIRQRLGEKVLKELPRRSPNVNQHYGIPTNGHQKVLLLINAGVSVGESIAGVQDQSIWGGEGVRQQIRRNIQYSQYLNPGFYLKVILHVLNRLSNT